MQSNAHVLTTGGTIASTKQGDGAEPTTLGDELVAAVPSVHEVADVTVEQVAMTASSDTTFETFADIARSAADAADAADGIVVTHGTSTLEEAAYYLDLCLDLTVPVVFTGAQRRPDQRSPDGPANLHNAVVAATDARFRPTGGVYVAVNDELHAAHDVTKSHSFKLNGFDSPDTGPVGRFDPDGLSLHREPGTEPVSIPVQETDSSVKIVRSGVDIGRGQIDRAVDARADGIVVEGTGLGNTTATLADGIVDAIDSGVPVVMTSRCYAGPVAPVYGYQGGNRMLTEAGVINAGDLPAHKARVKLLLALTETADPMDVGTYFNS